MKMVLYDCSFEVDISETPELGSIIIYYSKYYTVNTQALLWSDYMQVKII